VDITNLVAASAAGATLISTVLSALRADNTILKSQTSTRTRVIVAVVLGVSQLVLMTIAKQPVTEAVVSSIVSTATGIVASAAPRAVVAILGIWFAVNTTACAALTPKRVEAVERRVECVLEHRSMAPEQVAVLCALESPKDVVDIITGEDRRIGSARAIGEAEGRMLGASQCAPAKR
jgi:hypothetical protein